MSEAVEGADLILYGVSEKYKERCVFVRVVQLACMALLVLMWMVVRSANCRLELNYGMQHEVGASAHPRQELRCFSSCLRVDVTDG